jgi:catechol 2,3-dioxygenase-like lactoylglutathione lyase family enzyme
LHQTDQSAAPKVALSGVAPSERDQPVPGLKTVAGTFQRDAVQPRIKRCTNRSRSSNTLHCIRPILDPPARHVFGHRANDELADPVVSDRIPQHAPRTPDQDARRRGPFVSVHLDDGVHLDYAEPGIEFPGQHYALLVTDEVFDHALASIKEQAIPFSAGPKGPQNEINHHHGGRGVYFEDPSGHHFELITKPYGSAV